jgi:hypothetical protein
MKVSRLFLVACLFLGASLATGQDVIRLRFEVVKDGTTVAKPEIAIAAGATGSMKLDAVGDIAFTPTLRGSESVDIAFHVTSAGKEFQPRLVITHDEPGSLSWTSPGPHAFKLSVSWVR